MTPTRAALLCAVAEALIEADEPFKPLKPQKPRRAHVSRQEQIKVLSCDPRLNVTACKSEMVLYVMATYQVSNINARRMLHLARKMRHEAKSRRPC